MQGVLVAGISMQKWAHFVFQTAPLRLSFQELWATEGETYTTSLFTLPLGQIWGLSGSQCPYF